MESLDPCQSLHLECWLVSWVGCPAHKGSLDQGDSQPLIARRKIMWSECTVCLSPVHRISECAEQQCGCSRVREHLFACLASGNFCHPWPLPHLSARVLQPLPGIWLYELATVQQFSYQSESGLVTAGPYWVLHSILTAQALSWVSAQHLFLQLGWDPQLAFWLSLLGWRGLEEGPGEGRIWALPQPFHYRALVQACSGSLLSCESSLGLQRPEKSSEESCACDLQKCSPAPLTALPVPGWC